MLVIRAAVQHHVAFELGIAAVGLVGDFIGVQDIGTVVNLRLAAKFVCCALSLLLNGTNGDFLLGEARGRSSDGRGKRRQRGRGLAGYYRRSEKEMTKRKGRDNDSVA